MGGYPPSGDRRRHNELMTLGVTSDSTAGGPDRARLDQAAIDP